MKPNYDELGFSDSMGPKLREEVEQQLLEDLKHYIPLDEDLKFDWSGSCIEGTRTRYLDGEVEDFSGIKLFDGQDIVFAEGWMNFYHDQDTNLFIAYWDILNTYKYGDQKEIKNYFGMPEHVKKLINQ